MHNVLFWNILGKFAPVSFWRSLSVLCSIDVHFTHSKTFFSFNEQQFDLISIAESSLESFCQVFHCTVYSERI